MLAPLIFAVDLHGDRAPVAVAQCRFEGLGEALLQVLTHAQPIDHDLDGVLAVLREPRHGVDLVHLAVDPNADEAFRPQLEEQLDLLALAVHDGRGEDHELRPLRQSERRIDHL